LRGLNIDEEGTSTPRTNSAVVKYEHRNWNEPLGTTQDRNRTTRKGKEKRRVKFNLYEGNAKLAWRKYGSLLKS